MPSIFARSRTTSNPAKSLKSNVNVGNAPSPPLLPPKDVVPEEFGRVTSRGSTVQQTPSSKKDKKKDSKTRLRTQSSPQDPGEGPPPLPDGSFLPFSLEQQDTSEEPRPNIRKYGYLSYQSEVVLGLEEVTRLVEVISSELSERGLTTPFLFSSHAIDISPTRIKRLIDAFLRTCRDHRSDSFELLKWREDPQVSELKWREEAQFSGPHELAMTLRWGLARVVRISQSHETRGILSWETYLRWREDEGGALFPPQYFAAFLPSLKPEVQVLFTNLLAFLARLAAHATSSGLTPPTLSSLFGPLLFGLGSPALPFHHTYGAYLRCSHATEHLLLAYIRAQDAATSRAVGLPSRLKDWIRGYPSMIPPMEKLDKARRGARTVRITTVKRTVRLYSHDLVKTGASWCAKNESGNLCNSKEWARVMGPPNSKLVPRYSDSYRKRLEIPSGTLPDIGFDCTLSQSSSGSSTAVGEEFGLLGKDEEKRFRSLTDLKWGEFESLGFSGGDEKRLEFDLNEGARTARSEKRATISWNDFSTSGFSRNDDPLSATLQFAAPLSTTISAWPNRQTEIRHKLKKTQKALPAFGWDTAPVLGGEEAIEEGFLDVFCDLLYGSGWIDRQEQTFRECNWALVEYKSMPQSRPPGPLPAELRTGTSLWLYEEFVPLEYRSQLTAPKRKIPFSFATSKKSWKPATTRNGRPYVVGSVPRLPNPREVEFEGLLTGGNVTKVISLKPESHIDPSPRRAGTISSTMYLSPGDMAASPTVSSHSTSRRSRFLPGGAMRKRSPAEYDALDFETRTMFANLSEEELHPTDDKDPRRSKSSMGHTRKESKDDAWVDILVGAQRRMNDQAAEMRTSAGRRPLGRRSMSDPEMAREEIAQALKEAGPVPPEDDDVPLSQEQEQDHTRETTPSPTDEDRYGRAEDADSEMTPPRDSVDSADFEPMPHMRGLSQDGESSSVTTPFGHSRSESGLLPLNLQLNVAAAPQQIPRTTPERSVSSPLAVRKAAGKGVSSLIEMYSEREKESLAQSRLPVPVRSSSLSVSPSPPKPQPELPASASEVVDEDDEDPFVGRASPGAPRYIHGAPLHNVVEAPEEEDI